MKRTTSLCLALLLTHGLNVFGQDNPQARTESWRLSIKAESFDKLLVQGHLYYFLVYTVTNASQHSRAAQLNIFAVIDRVRDGVNPQKTAGFNQFRKHQLPQWPREHDTREFDNRKAVPLPLWYAQQAVQVVKKKGILEFYKRETLRAMQEEQVDQAWLAGWEDE